MPLTENFPRKKSSTFSPKSQDRESTPSDEKLGSSVTGGKATKSSAEHTNVFVFPLVNENRESKDTTVIDIGPKDNYLKGGCMPTSNQRLEGTSSSNGLAGNLNGRNMNGVPHIVIDDFDGKERHELQELKHGNHLDHRLESTSSSNRANGLERNANDTIIDIEMPQDLKDMSSQLFNICKRGDTACFLEKINFLYEHERNCLYDVLLSQNEEDQDTLLHVAIKGNNVDLVKEILHILAEPYNSDDSYECRYFKDKKENEKPLSKAINARNRESCKALEYIGNEEIAQLFIKCYDGRIENLRKELDNSCIQLEQAERILRRRKSIFSYSGASSFGAQVCRVGFDVCRAVFDETIGRIPFLGLAVSSIFGLLASPPGLMVHLIHRTNEELSRYKEENSSLQKEFESCVEERGKLKEKLSSLESNALMNSVSQQLFEMSLQYQSCTEELVGLRKKVSFLEESYSTQVNSASVQLVDPGRNSVFASPSG